MVSLGEKYLFLSRNEQKTVKNVVEATDTTFFGEVGPGSRMQTVDTRKLPTCAQITLMFVLPEVPLYQCY